MQRAVAAHRTSERALSQCRFCFDGPAVRVVGGSSAPGANNNSSPPLT
jgi:hypothetical protein